VVWRSTLQTEICVKTLQLLGIFCRGLAPLSFSQLLHHSTTTRQPTYRALQQLIKQNILKKTRIANADLYYPNMEMAASLLSYLDSLELTATNKLLLNSINVDVVLFIISKKVSKTTSTYIITSDKASLSKQLKKKHLSANLLTLQEFQDGLNDFHFIQKLRGHRSIFNGERYYREIKSLFTNIV